MKNTIYNVNSDNSCTMNISTLSMKDRTDKTKDSLSIANLQLGEANYPLSIVTALLIVFCLLFGGKAFAQTIVVNGTGTNQYVPMYNWYNDYGHRSEYIIPASYFSSAGITNGARLNSITLYRSATGSWTAKDLTIKLTNTSTTDYSNTSFLGLNGTTVYTNSSYSGGSSSSYTFNFSSPFTYTGGSLVVHIYAGNGGTCASSSTASTWYGISSTSNYQACYASGSNSANATTGTRLNFLPKTAFSYTAGAPSSSAPSPYCTPTLASTTTTYYISNVTTTGGATNINNTTTGAGHSYSNFYNLYSVSAYAESTINFTITIAGGSTHGSAIWVDWNKDGDFSDDGERVYNTTTYASSPHSGSFTIPSNASSGD